MCCITYHCTSNQLFQLPFHCLFASDCCSTLPNNLLLQKIIPVQNVSQLFIDLQLNGTHFRHWKRTFFSKGEPSFEALPQAYMGHSMPGRTSPYITLSDFFNFLPISRLWASIGKAAKEIRKSESSAKLHPPQSCKICQVAGWHAYLWSFVIRPVLNEIQRFLIHHIYCLNF